MRSPLQPLSSAVPQPRLRQGNSLAPRADGDYVLYWMIAFRRLEWNFSLSRAVEWARELKKPLVVFEPLRVDYSWASDRMHRFILDGMADNATHVAPLKSRGVLYMPYVEPRSESGKGLLEALAARACVVVADDDPAFFLPRMVAAATRRLQVKLELVDSNGLLPLQATERVFTTAASFRALLQKELPAHLEAFPPARPLAGVRLPPLKSLPTAITRRWKPASEKLLSGSAAALAALPIDHSVAVVDERGGPRAARRKLRRFLNRVQDYVAIGNHPDENVRSELSASLHFGHISPHEMFHELMVHERWSPQRLGRPARGKRQGWWGTSADGEAWLDQFVTWRELGYNFAAHRDDGDQYDSLPAWSRATLEKHARDRREFTYSLDEFARAATHDPLWNAAQTQLLREGRIHNYLRMLWGKKILEWTVSPRQALDVMIELNNRYALDGRDPNSYSGILWCLGRYDRPWGPERPIFGTVRYMSSASARRKLHVKEYLRRWAVSLK